ncbi:MAG TPA: hypothetical protein VEW03_00740, partial [Longimicrobiaceae bacterium]|nr:hypothetical protein [Longimicrobiaceae bacterium]
MRWGLVAAGVAAWLVASPARAQAGETPIASALAVETFDTAWAVVNRTMWDTTFNGVDWNAVRAELRPRAEAARSYQALRRVLGEMLGRLRLSHFGIIPGEAQARLSAGEAGEGGRPGDAGMEVRLVGDRFLVTRVAPGGAA